MPTTSLDAPTTTLMVAAESAAAGPTCPTTDASTSQTGVSATTITVLVLNALPLTS